MAALLPGGGCLLVVFREIAWIVFRTAAMRRTRLRVVLAGLGMAAAMTGLAAFPACLGRTLTVVGEVTGTMLTANRSGPRCLLPVLGKIARISRVWLLSHQFSPSCLPGVLIRQ